MPRLTRLRQLTTLPIIAVALALHPSAGAQTASQPATSPERTETPAVVVPERFDSPRSTMMTYLSAMKAYAEATSSSRRNSAIREAVSTFDLSNAEKEASDIAAEKLLLIINRIGEVHPRELPSNAAAATLTSYTFFPRQRASGHHRLTQLAPEGRIEIVKTQSGAWMFSAETLANVPELYRKVESLPIAHGVESIRLSNALRIRSRMPDKLTDYQFLTLEYWQWLGLFVVIFLAVVLDVVVQFVLRGFAVFLIRKRGGEARKKTLKRASRPFGLFIAAIFALFAIRFLGLPPKALAILLAAVRVVLISSGVWAAFRLTDLVAEVGAQLAARSDTKLDDLLIPLLRKTIKILIVVIGLIYIAQSLYINIWPLLTGLGIGGLAVAFAARDTIENFFGSLTVVLDRPFEVGDWIAVNDTEGTVEELGFRSTRVRTFYNSLITVPNATLVRASVDNFGRRRYRRIKANLSLTYQTPPEKIDAFCEGVREIIRLHPYTRKDYFHVYFNSYGDSSLNVLLYTFLETPDWSTELREKHRLYSDILRLAHELGVSFAYPTQTLFLEREQPADAPQPPDKGFEREAQRDGVRAAAKITQKAEWRDKVPAPVEIIGKPTLEKTRGSEGDAGGEGGH